MQKQNEDSTQADETVVEENETTTAEELVEDIPQEDVAPDGDAPEDSEEEIDPWKALEMEAAKWKDQAVRTAAELDNYRKRMAREKLDAVRYGNQSLLEELLPVLDNFDMGMQAAAQEQGSMLYLGMDMVRKQLGEFLGSQNVAEIPAEAGAEFDPNLHEALSQEPSDKIKTGNIVRVMRKGYRIGERLLRPANVVVATSTPDSPEPGQPESE